VQQFRFFLLAAGALAWAQESAAAGMPFGAGPRFLGAEAGVPRHVVKGAPFSGDWIGREYRDLADGNRIRQNQHRAHGPRPAKAGRAARIAGWLWARWPPVEARSR